jgi:hypothetical protein
MRRTSACLAETKDDDLDGDDEASKRGWGRSCASGSSSFMAELTSGQPVQRREGTKMKVEERGKGAQAH